MTFRLQRDAAGAKALFSERAALREDAARLLDELGATPGEVCYSLYVMRVPARPWDTGGSPAAAYLRAVVGADNRVKAMAVTKRWLVMRTGRRWRSTVRVRLPRPVREFTAAVERTPFDRVTEARVDGEQV